MKHLLWLLLLLSPAAFAQKAQCSCAQDSNRNSSVMNCDTTLLKSGGKLFWQLNCDRVWLTLIPKDGGEVVIDQLPADFYGYVYRLGFQLIKEYKNGLLFRSGCPANGPCNYILINTKTGKRESTLGQLICIDTDISEEQKPYNFPFIVYFSDDRGNLIVHFVDSHRKISVPFKEEINARIPESAFEKMRVRNNILELTFLPAGGGSKVVNIDLK